MKRLLAASFLLASALFTTSCGVPSGSSGDPSPIDSFSTLGGSSFTSAGRDLISGTGKIQFDEPTSDHSYSITLTANLKNTNSAITLYVKTSTSSLSDGIRIKFRNKGSLDIAGSAKINSGTESFMQSTSFNTLQPNSLQIIVDIHDDGSTPVRILVWRQNAGEFTDVSADIDTDVAADMSPSFDTTSHATGSLWAADIVDSDISYLRLGNAKVRD